MMKEHRVGDCPPVQQSPPYRPRCARRVMAATALAAGALAPGGALAQGVGYTVAPAASSIQWTDRLGLDNTSMYGGILSFDFDRFASLQGFYFTNSGVQTALGRLDLSGPIAGQLGDQQLDVRSYGANLVLNLWSGGVAPFVKAGGGILELRPDIGGRSRQVALNVGGGLRIGANAPVFLDLFAEDMIFRLDRYSLFAPTGGTGAVIPADPDANTIRHNLVVGAAVGIPLGPARSDIGDGGTGPFQWGLAGASLAVEPMAGRLTFHDDVSIDDQDLVGVRAGFDLGRLVGLRGFYWRGTENDFKRTAPVQSWGGEAQFRLNSGPGLNPYLLVGGAQLDFRDEFRNTNGLLPNDRTALILGGGVTLPLGERIGLNLTARDYLFGSGSGIDSISTPSDLKSNWMFSAGLRFSVGGRSGSSVAEASRERQQRYAERLDSLREENARLAERNRRDPADLYTRELEEDSLWAMQFDEDERADRLAERRRLRRAADDRQALRELAQRRARGDTAFAGDVDLDAVRSDYASDRTLTLPAPALGELYVRYGPADGARPGTVFRSGDPRARLFDMGDSTAAREGLVTGDLSPEELRRVIRETMREEMRAMYAAPAQPSAVSPTLVPTPDRETRAPGTPDSVASDSARRIPLRPKDASGRPLTPAEAPARAGVSNEELANMLANRLDATLDARLTRMQDSMRIAMRDEVRRTMAAERTTAPAVPAPVTPTESPAPPQRVRDVSIDGGRRFSAYSGANLNDGGQLLLGARFDAGPLNWQAPGVRFVPELAVGFGSGGQSTMIVGNALYRFGTFQLSSLPALTPHVVGGLGLLNFSDRVGSRDGLEAVVNLGYGVSFPLGNWSLAGSRPVLQVEHQGVDFFNLNRLLVGLQWRLQ